MRAHLIDVAKIAFVTGLTFWLGNAFVLGLGMAIAPEAASALDQLPPWINRAIGLAGLAAICGYLMWLTGGARVVGAKGVSVTSSPSAADLCPDSDRGADLGLSAIGMYILLPANPPVELLPFVVIFVLATLLGFLSHTPGALGVFDAAILIALAQYPKEELLATLLVWRAIYYILPFSLALVVMAAREICIASRRGRTAEAGSPHSAPSAPTSPAHISGNPPTSQPVSYPHISAQSFVLVDGPMIRSSDSMRSRIVAAVAALTC